MADRKDTEASSGQTPALPEGAPEQALPTAAAGPTQQPVAEAPSAELLKIAPDLPMVDSPSLSPAGPVTEPVSELEPTAAPIPEIPMTASEPAAEPVSKAAAEPAASFIPRIRPRHKRMALLAASVLVAASLGGIVGAVSTGAFAPTPVAPAVDVAAAEESKAALEERKALQQSLTKLTREVTTLKASLDAANKAATSQIAKISERVERTAAANEITGSISAPQTVAPAATPTLTPMPRPAPRTASGEPAPSTAPVARSPVLQDWTVRVARDGFVYVEGHGDIYQVVPGAPLPGLGPVQSIRRQDGRWVVTTPRGIIVSMRDRRYFE